MTEEDRLRDLLRAAYPPPTGRGPSRDLWVSVVARIDAPPVRPSRLDVALAALIAVLLIVFPRYLWLVVYHM
jgi:hypothetical protein